MDGLEGDLREVLNLRIVKGYSLAETASILKRTEAEVYAGQYRALFSLARWLDQSKE
ncbi:MAG: hypothetical protein ABRQ24_04485 [Syntrophomonadaceae bacterium]